MSVQPNGGGIRLDAPGAVYATHAEQNSSSLANVSSRRSLTGRKSGLSYPLPAQSIIGAERNPFMFDNRHSGRRELDRVAVILTLMFVVPILGIVALLSIQ